MDVLPADAAPATDLQDFCPPALLDGVTRLAPLLYGDLKRLAHRERLHLFSPNTLTTTALIHEAFLRLHDQPGFATHGDFLRVAAVTMRHILIDRVRAQLAQKRGGDVIHVPLEDATELVVQEEETVLAIHDAIRRLAEFAPRLASVVECRYFAGYSDKEIAEALGVTERTVRRDWVSAKAWLGRELGENYSLEAR